MAGLEVLFSLVKEKLTSKADAIVAFIHWTFIKNGQKCVGIGESWPDSQEKRSELLPADWSKEKGAYSLRYTTDDGKRYLLKIIQSDQFILLNLLNVTIQKAAGSSVNLNDYVSDMFQDYESVYKKPQKLEEIVKKLLTDVEKQSNQTSEASQTQKKDENVKPEYYPPGMPLYMGDEYERRNPLSVGRGDLDPLGGMDGGMLMDPRGMSRFRNPTAGIPGQFPRGVVPPGARFDPIGPDLGNQPGYFRPGPDHLPPPGSYDNYFM